ncbi:MAG: AAA family ATPase [Acidobacteria bacterium]|nr:AAA family ATPase [Acidobacteriota bacterium]
MAARLRTMLPNAESQRVWISTFHRLCGRLLRDHGTAIDVPADFRIVEGAERIGVMRQCMFDANVDIRIHKPQALLHRISTLKNRMRTPADPDEWEDDGYAERNARLAAAYQAALAGQGGLDFDDMLLGAVRLLHESPDARRAAGDRFPRVLVDEYQDTNLPQYVLVRQIAEGRDDVFVVGDPDQAIYGWRGAELQNILDFHHDFPKARRIDLQLAYRSTARLLEAAGAMIRSNGKRLDHTLRCANPAGQPPAVRHVADATAEAGFAVERAAARIRQDGGEVAVLYRTNAQSGSLENAFRRAGIRYRITGGESFYSRPEILDALCCLQAAADPDDDEAMHRFVELPPHPRTGRKTCALIDSMPGRSFRERVERATHGRTLSTYHATNLRRRLELAATLHEATRRLPLDELVDEALDCTGYRRAAAEAADGDAEDRLDNLAELAYDASVFARDDGGTTDTPDGRRRLLAAFLEHCRAMRTPERDDGTVRVTLSTLHGAKGLEFDTVVITGFDAEHLPHRRTVAAAADANAAIEEERRLAYVGMTRARTELCLSVPAVTGHGAKQRPTAPSPFLDEIPENLRTTVTPAGAHAEPSADVTMGPLGPERSL